MIDFCDVTSPRYAAKNVCWTASSASDGSQELAAEGQQRPGIAIEEHFERALRTGAKLADEALIG